MYKGLGPSRQSHMEGTKGWMPLGDNVQHQPALGGMSRQRTWPLVRCHKAHPCLQMGVLPLCSVGFIVGLVHNTFNKSINSMVRNIMWCMICTVWEFD
jgi:hypothetical protein